MNDNEEQITVKLRVDWGIGPFWVSINDDVSDPYDTDEITEFVTLSSDLRSAIAAWDEWFQSTLDPVTPQNSGIHDPDEEQKFLNDGLRLTQRIKHEAPHLTVEYSPMGDAAITIEPVPGPH